MQKGMSLFRS